MKYTTVIAGVVAAGAIAFQAWKNTKRRMEHIDLHLENRMLWEKLAEYRQREAARDFASGRTMSDDRAQ